MEEVTAENAPSAVRDMFNRGFAALERGNLDYAIDMLGRCVDIEPAFFRARKLLRAAEVRQWKNRKQGGLSRLMSQAGGIPLYVTAQAKFRSGKPMEALQAAEKLLRIDPLNPMYVKILGQAAEAAHLPEIAIQTLAVAREHDPDNIFILNWLGSLYMETHQTKLGRQCFEELAALKPNDAAALKALKDAMAIHSMSADGWSEAATSGSYRDVIKDEKESVLLEQQAKAVKSELDVQSLIAEALSKIQKEPENLNYRRSLGSLYASNRMFAEAIAALDEAQKLAGGRDPQIDAAISNTRVQQFDHEIAELGGRGEGAAAAAKQKEKEEFLYSDVHERIKRYPNDLQLRYDYGVQLLARGLINDAVQQFQLSQRHAQRRVRSLYYIGICFKQKKQYDLAVEQLEKAAAEQPIMDESKKDVLYELGQIMELMGDPKKALEYYKPIYQTDIGYRDVAAKIEKGYKA